MAQNPDSFDYSFWSRAQTSHPRSPDPYREHREREHKQLRHELAKALSVKPLSVKPLSVKLLSCRDSDGNYRGTKGELLDPAALHHLGIEVPGAVPVEPGEPNWHLHVDRRRPVIGDIVELTVSMVGKLPFLQLFEYTKAGRIPDGPPHPIRWDRLRCGASIYACDHEPPPPKPQPDFPEPEPNLLEWQLESQYCHPKQYAHLNPELVAQVLPHPHARFLPDARPFPWEPPGNLSPVLIEWWWQNTYPHLPLPEKYAPASTPRRSKPVASSVSSNPAAKPAAPQSEDSQPTAADPNADLCAHTEKSEKSVFTPPVEDSAEPSIPPEPPASSAPAACQPETQVPSATESPVPTQPDPLSPLEPECQPPYESDIFIPKAPNLNETQREILLLVSQGTPAVTAAQRLGISHTTLNEWPKSQPAFRQDVIDARNHFCESLCSRIDAIHGHARDLLRLWLQSSSLPESQRFRTAKLILQSSHSPHLIPRRLARLMPYNASGADEFSATSEYTQKSEKSVFTPGEHPHPSQKSAQQAVSTFSPMQQRVIELVEHGHTVVSAMNELQLARDTFYTWRRRNPAFRKAVAEARDRYCESIAASMEGLINQARAELEACILKDDVSLSVRFRAIEFFLRHVHTDLFLPRSLHELMPHTMAPWRAADPSLQAENPPAPSPREKAEQRERRAWKLFLSALGQQPMPKRPSSSVLPSEGVEQHSACESELLSAESNLETHRNPGSASSDSPPGGDQAEDTASPRRTHRRWDTGQLVSVEFHIPGISRTVESRDHPERSRSPGDIDDLSSGEEVSMDDAAEQAA